MYPLQVGAFATFLTSPHQLRLRVLFALNQIFVVSAVNTNLAQPSRMLPYLQVLSNGAFGNFRQLLTDITLNPAMGRYLDMVGNTKSAPNENYGRELLQLFTIGLNQLNADGTLRLSASGEPIPTYDQTTITAFARAFTAETTYVRSGSLVFRSGVGTQMSMTSMSRKHDMSVVARSVPARTQAARSASATSGM